MLVSLAQQLRSQSEVIKTARSLECWKYQTISAIEGYVDAELYNGKSVAWHLEVQWNEEEWLIMSQITVNDAHGQDVLRAFPPRVSNTFEACIEQLSQATIELVSSADLMDLKLF